MRHWIRHRLPTEETLQAHPGLRWMGPLLRRPWLWQLSRRRVALGAGIGVFFGFLTPIAQMAGASLSAVILRANLPVAVVSTLVSNPLTYAPIFVLAYRTGDSLLGGLAAPHDAEADALVETLEAEVTPAAGWAATAKSIGKPLFVGLAVFACVGSVLAWASVYLVWTLVVWLRMRRQRRIPGPVG